MERRGSRILVIVALSLAALALGALGSANWWGERVSNSLLFAAWCLALLVLFVLGMGLPLRLRVSKFGTWLTNIVVASVAVAIVIAANVALFHHDVHLDLSREARNTPPPEIEAVVDHLQTDLVLTYFYNDGDDRALRAKDLLLVAARDRPRFHDRAVDLDKEPGLARDFGVHAYNTFVLQAGQRRVVIENTTDLTGLAYAALRVLKSQTDTVCFVTGHGESFREQQAHFHYSHVETLKGHDVPGAGDVLVGEPDGLDRLALALTEIGYTARPLVLATVTEVPADCTVVADIGVRTAYAAGEASVLANFLGSGGRLLLLLDVGSAVGPELDQLLGSVGLRIGDGIVIDPLNHFRSDPDKVAVPYYPPHPITDRLALTIFPRVRPIMIAGPTAGVKATVLASSSQDSFIRPAASLADAHAGEGAAPDDKPAVQALAVALEGAWPRTSAGAKPFRLVVAGTSKFATNEYFPFVSNGELAVGMLRWLASDDTMPTIRPAAYSLPEITLTSRQMRNVFLILEVVLPLSTLLLGVAVWWRRR
jgi:hypothetical protein